MPKRKNNNHQDPPTPYSLWVYHGPLSGKPCIGMVHMVFPDEKTCNIVNTNDDYDANIPFEDLCGIIPCVESFINQKGEKIELGSCVHDPDSIVHKGTVKGITSKFVFCEEKSRLCHCLPRERAILLPPEEEEEEWWSPSSPGFRIDGKSYSPKLYDMVQYHLEGEGLRYGMIYEISLSGTCKIINEYNVHVEGVSPNRVTKSSLKGTNNFINTKGELIELGETIQVVDSWGLRGIVVRIHSDVVYFEHENDRDKFSSSLVEFVVLPELEEEKDSPRRQPSPSPPLRRATTPRISSPIKKKRKKPWKNTIWLRMMKDIAACAAKENGQTIIDYMIEHGWKGKKRSVIMNIAELAAVHGCIGVLSHLMNKGIMPEEDISLPMIMGALHYKHRKTFKFLIGRWRGNECSHCIIVDTLKIINEPELHAWCMDTHDLYH